MIFKIHLCLTKTNCKINECTKFSQSRSDPLSSSSKNLNIATAIRALPFLHHYRYVPLPQLINPIQLLPPSIHILRHLQPPNKREASTTPIPSPFPLRHLLPFTAKKKTKNSAMARMLTTALFFAFLAISVNAQAPAAIPETAPEALSPSIFSAETPEAEPDVAIPASSPSGFVEGPVSSIGIGAPLISESIAAAPDSESSTDVDSPTEAPVASPNSIAAAPSSWEYAPSNAPETAPSLEAPGSEYNDFADGPIADSPDTAIESPPSPPISDAPATAPSSDPSSGAIRTVTGFALAGLVASVLVVAAF